MGRRKGGEGGYIRIQNKSSFEIEIQVKEGRNVDDMGMDQIQGVLAAGDQLPTEGKQLFDDGGVYQYIEGDVRNRFQKDGYFFLEAHLSDGSSPESGLKLVVDHNSWSSHDPSPDNESKILMIADVDEEDNIWKIEIRVYNNYPMNSWMASMAQDIQNTRICNLGIPGTHDSITYEFSEDKGASPDSDLTSTIQDKLDHGRFLGKLNDMILRNVFKRLCQCQDKTTKEQLEAGIRYLDLRVAYHEESGEFWTCHGVFCVNMVDVLKEIKEFLSSNPKVRTTRFSLSQSLQTCLSFTPSH